MCTYEVAYYYKVLYDWVLKIGIISQREKGMCIRGGRGRNIALANTQRKND